MVQGSSEPVAGSGCSLKRGILSGPTVSGQAPISSKVGVLRALKTQFHTEIQQPPSAKASLPQAARASAGPGLGKKALSDIFVQLSFNLGFAPTRDHEHSQEKSSGPVLIFVYRGPTH